MITYFIYKRNGELTPSLYAVTNKKELKDSFMNERRNDIFITIKKELSKEDYKLFLSKHNGFNLGIRGFNTKPSNSSLLKKDTINIVATADEEIQTFINLDKVFSILSKYTSEYSQGFNIEILKSLEKIGYFIMLKNKNPMNQFLAGIQEYEIDSFPLKPDEFSVFMKLYGYTFKETK